MNKWWWLLLSIVCWMAIGFAAFGWREDRNSSEPALPVRVDRIVSMAPSLTEILFALGLDEEIVGVTLLSDYPPAAAEKPKVGGFWQPNIEAVVAARPNLVMTLGFGQQKDLAERLKRIGYNTLTVNIEKVSDLFTVIGEIGAAADRQRQADELVSGIKEKLNALSALIGALPEVRVLWVVQRKPLRVAGRDTFVNEMIKLAGGENAIGRTVHKYPPIGAEQVIACGADVIIEPEMGRGNLDAQRNEALRHWGKFRNLPAVTNNRIYVIRGDTVSRLGPRLYEGTETIARCLRPHLFEN
ncbi:MAG: ABC transporter substrate-binding protein [Planctomycetes bacterium]|nr:ABC transporter substrate-binding protein [Planctomycetota bacterium]